MSKIARKYMAHYIDVANPEDGEFVFERLGRDLEEYSVSMSAQVETRNNILGETDVCISSYQKTGDVANHYADDETELYNRLQTIIRDGLVLDDLRTHVVDVYLWDYASDNNYSAVMEEAYIEVKSYGGDTSGYQIPFALHYTGKQQKGRFDIDNLVFTPDETEE